MNIGASPYNMVAGAGTPGPMMSPAPNQDSMGYNMSINGTDYSSTQVWHDYHYCLLYSSFFSMQYAS